MDKLVTLALYSEVVLYWGVLVKAFYIFKSFILSES